MQADPIGTDWSAWDLGHSMQLLRSRSPAVVRRTLRTLHLRWWHVPAKQMRKLLQAAGAPVDAIKQVDEIVDTCRACRMWKLPSPANATTSRLVERFNDVVQHDLLFVSPQPCKTEHTSNDPRAEPWQHLLDSCIRYTQATILKDKSSKELFNALEFS